jgi:hypothetical protein
LPPAVLALLGQHEGEPPDVGVIIRFVPSAVKENGQTFPGVGGFSCRAIESSPSGLCCRIKDVTRSAAAVVRYW